MQQPDKRAPWSLTRALKVVLRFSPQVAQLTWSKPSSERFKHAKETFITGLRNDGMPDEIIKVFEAMIATFQEIQEDRETYHKLDTFLIGGLGIVSLVLLQVLVS